MFIKIQTETPPLITIFMYFFPARLVDGTENEGYVEIYMNGSWSKVCDDSWGAPESDVLCLTLGVAGGVPYHYLELILNGEEGTFVHQVQCVGNETDISDCLISTDATNYTCSVHVKVFCENLGMLLLILLFFLHSVIEELQG